MSSWWIYTQGGGDVLYWAFTGIASVMGQGSGYVRLMAVGALLGIIVLGFQSAFGGRFSRMSGIYLLVFCCLVFGMFVPRATVVIKDVVVQPSHDFQIVTVPNVPLGIATLASLSSTVGNYLATKADTAFQFAASLTDPTPFRYTDSGLLAGSRVLQSSLLFEPTSPELFETMEDFMVQCVMYDILDDRYGWDGLAKSGDIWGFLATKNLSLARSFNYFGELQTCQSGFPLLTATLDKNTEEALNIYALKIFPERSLAPGPNGARQLLERYLVSSYSFLVDAQSIAGDAKAIVRQNMVINLMRQAMAGRQQDLQSAYATAMAQAQTETSGQVLATRAGDVLPKAKAILETVLYASFFILLLIWSLPWGPKAMQFYLEAIFGLQLWAPLYSILNMVLNVYAYKHTQAAAIVDATAGSVTHELSLLTARAIESATGDTIYLAANMVWAIPMLSIMMVAGGHYAAVQMAGDSTGGLKPKAEGEGGDAGAGRVRLAEGGMDNFSFGQHTLQPNVSSGYPRTDYQAAGPSRVTSYADGTGVLHVDSPHAPAGLRLSQELATSATNQAEQAHTAALRFGEQVGSHERSAFQDIVQASSQYQNATQFRDDWSRRDAANFANQVNEYRDVVDQVAEELGGNRQFAQQVVGTFGLGTGAALPILQAKLESTGMSGSQAQERANQLYQTAHRQGWAETVQRTWDSAHTLQNSDLDSDTKSHLNTATANHDKAVDAAKSSSRELQRSYRYSSAASRLRSAGTRADHDAMQMFIGWYADEIGDVTPGLSEVTNQLIHGEHLRDGSWQRFVSDTLDQVVAEMGIEAPPEDINAGVAAAEQTYDGYASQVVAPDLEAIHEGHQQTVESGELMPQRKEHSDVKATVEADMAEAKTREIGGKTYVNAEAARRDKGVGERLSEHVNLVQDGPSRPFLHPGNQEVRGPKFTQYVPGSSDAPMEVPPLTEPESRRGDPFEQTLDLSGTPAPAEVGAIMAKLPVIKSTVNRPAVPPPTMVARDAVAPALADVIEGTGPCQVGLLDGGHVIYGVRDTVWANLGLKDGDLLEGINGVPLDSRQGLVDAQQSLQSADVLKLEGSRNGKPFAFIYPITNN